MIDRTVDFADLGEAALDAFEPFEAGNDCVVGNSELQRDGDRGKRILDIVAAGDRHVHGLDRPPLAVLVEDHARRSGCRRRPA